MLVYPPGLLCWEPRQFLNPPCEQASRLPSLCYSSGCAGAEVLPPQCWSPSPPPQGNGLLLMCFLWSTVQSLQSRGKLFCCKAQALPSQPPIGLLRWECIYLLGLGLFLWKNCSGQELYWVSQRDCCPVPGAVTAAAAAQRPGPPNRGQGFVSKAVLGFCVPLVSVSS